MKHPQHILAFDKQQFGHLKSGFNDMKLQDFLERAKRSLVIGRREEFELDERYGQMLPYVVLYKMIRGEARLFTYRRGKGVGEARLAGNGSIGIGGHVDLADVLQENSIIDVLGTIHAALKREWTEEIKVTEASKFEVKPVFMGILNDTSNPVGAVHYGLLYAIKLPEDAKVECIEEELDTVGFLSQEQLSVTEKVLGFQLENWSKIVGLTKAYLEIETLGEIL